MRIASSFHLPGQPLTGFVAAFLCVFGSCLAAPVNAQQAAAVVAPVAPAATAQPAATAGAPAASATPVKETIEKSMTKVEDKLIESAKAEVKKLDNVPDETTLSELNRVRQTISRIEAMIDVERRLNELEKLRSDRNKTGSVAAIPGLPANLAEAIPASALAFPAGQGFAGGGARQIRDSRIINNPPQTRRPTLQRITGAGGKYSAVLKVSDETKSVRVGDKISDGEFVRSITSSSVEIGGKGSSYTLHIKNVEMVHSIVR